MASVVGFAFLWLSVTAVGKQVSLLVVAAIPNAMLCMTTTAGMVQKAAFGRSKSPPLAVKKQQFVGPSLTLTKGWKFILVVFEEVVVHTFPFGKVGMGLPYGNSFRVTAACEGFIRRANLYLVASICGLYKHKKPWRLLLASPFCGCR